MSGSYTSWPDVEIDGSPLDERVLPRLCRAVIDHHLHLPDTFSLTFDDGEQDLLDKTGVHVGSTVKITARGLGQVSSALLINGEVTALAAEYAAGRDQTTVRGYDRSHRLHRGRRVQSYQNVKISDVAETVAARAGLEIGTIDDSGSVLEHVTQHNVTDWEFLKAQARELGFEVGVFDGRFYFRKPKQSAEAPTPGSDESVGGAEQLVYGRDLIHFRPHLNSAAQVSQINVRAWDPATKSVLTSSAQPNSTHAQLHTDPSRIASTFGSPSFLVHDRPLSAQTDVDAVAGSVSELLGSAFAEAEGVVTGNARLRAGTAVSVGEVHPQFQGKYTLSRSRHVFDDDGYRTEFQVGGRQDRSLLGLASLGASNGAVSAGGRAMSGVVVAQVTNNDDPDRLGRIKLKFPWLSSDYESGWARVCQVGAGPNSGMVYLPEKDDEVLVAFEFGDIRRPYVISPLHNGQDKPHLGDGLIDSGTVKRRGAVSRKGHKFIFFEDDSKSGIALLTSDGNLRLALNETTGEVHIHCRGKVTIDTDTDEIKISSGADLTLAAQGSVHITGESGVKIETSAALDVSGAPIKLN